MYTRSYKFVVKGKSNFLTKLSKQLKFLVGELITGLNLYENICVELYLHILVILENHLMGDDIL